MTTTKTKTDDRGFARILERQMRNWELAHQEHGLPPRRNGKAVQDFISLSRAVGLPGRGLAEALAARLGWPLFDREILDIMAGDDEYRRRLYESMDERDQGWLESILNAVGGREGSRDDYFHRLQTTVLTLARKSRTIFLGRAADLILPTDAGLRVRLHASREHCIRAFAGEQGVPEKAAAEQVEAVEHDRARFFRHHFGADAASLERHDLILNMERLSVANAVDIILAALQAKCGAA